MEKLADILLSLEDYPSQFSVNGVVQGTPLPALHIDRVGPVHVPLTNEQEVENIKDIAVDMSTDFNDSKCYHLWQLQPSQVTIRNSAFQKKLNKIITDVKQKLVCNSTDVEVELFKVLLFERGMDCKGYIEYIKRNGVKARSYASLIVQLPSIFEGCHHKFQHGTKKNVVKFDIEESQYEMIYAAHHIDFEQEVTPMQSGYRLVFVYNFAWVGTSNPPTLDGVQICEDKLSGLLKQMIDDGKDVFGWALKNDYNFTQEVSILEGVDKVVASFLRNANEQLKKNHLTFYLVEINRETKEYGTRDESKPKSKWFDNINNKMTEDTTNMLLSGVNFEGKKFDCIDTIPFKLETDLLNFDKTFSSDLQKFWGDFYDETTEGPKECDCYDRYQCGAHDCGYYDDDKEDVEDDYYRAIRTRKYKHLLLLALSPKQTFKLLCKQKLMKESLDILSQMFLSQSDNLVEFFQIFINEFKPSDYSEESIQILTQILTNVANVDLIRLFINGVLMKTGSNKQLGYCSEGYVIYPGTEKYFSELFQSVPWVDIKDQVEALVSICWIKYRTRLHRIGKLSGIKDICKQVQETLCKKIHTSQPQDESLSLFFVDLNVNYPMEYLLLLNRYIEDFPSIVSGSHAHTAKCVFTIAKPAIQQDALKGKLKELCNVIVQNDNTVGICAKILPHIHECKQSCSHIDTVNNSFNIFMDAFLKYINVDKLDVDLDDDFAIAAKVLFSDDSYNDHLQKFLAISRVNNVNALGEILKYLCCQKDCCKENVENLPKLKSNVNFRSALCNYLLLLQTRTFGPDSRVYSTILEFLFDNEKWCDDLSTGLLPGLINANCIKNNFSYYACIISSVSCYNTEGYKMLVNTALKALNLFLEKQKISNSDYHSIRGFIITLLSQDWPLDVPALKLNDSLNMYANKQSFLVRLVSDLTSRVDYKEKFQHLKQYKYLMSLRVDNLKETISKGKPVVCWKQPDALIPDHLDVELFLRSNLQRFTFKSENFYSINDARNWASKYFPSRSDGAPSRKNYYCQTSVRGSGRNAFVEITKEITPKHNSDIKQFDQFPLELQRLEALVDNKRSAGEVNYVPTKKPLIEKNEVVESVASVDSL